MKNNRGYLLSNLIKRNSHDDSMKIIDSKNHYMRV